MLAHPRVGGENHLPERKRCRDRGSSPRGRGKRNRGRHRSSRARLIPAWAGKTRIYTEGRDIPGAHPRVGGENEAKAKEGKNIKGSSPRGRGKPEDDARAKDEDRLIPAWAGKTSTHERVSGRWRAHPRVGGENGWVCPCLWSRLGSSPRGRGKRHGQPASHVCPGLIPAWAGKTRRGWMAWACLGAHPRVGGENEFVPTEVAEGSGSSPRGRGKRPPGCRLCGPHRLIPAWAGKTSPASRSARRVPAHPRVGGENPCARWRPRRTRGSSPRGRGKRAHDHRLSPPLRLIPAWAGKTCASTAWVP